MRLTMFVSICLLAGMPTVVDAQQKPQAPPANACARLTQQFDRAEKGMAASDVEGLLDNSAPRAQIRAQEIGNSLVQAQIAIELMRARSCPMPDHVPVTSTYWNSAVMCKNDEVKGVKDSPKCDRDTWIAFAA